MSNEPVYTDIDLNLSNLFYRQPPLPTPKPAPELAEFGGKLLDHFATRVLPWVGEIQGRPAELLPPVHLVDPVFFALQGLARTAGWFNPKIDQIVVATPVDDNFKRSVVLHESVHWMQYHTWPDMDWHEAEYEAYKVQMAWLATQGFDIRSEGRFFTPNNLLGFTHSAELFHDDYAWLKKWEKEYVK